MTIFEMEYLGLATVDKRLSNPMLPWIIPQIRRGASSTKVRVGVDKSLLELRGGPTNLSHPLSLITRLAVFPKDQDGGYLLYALKDPEQPLLYCHLLAADDFQDLMDLMAAMKEQSNRVKTPTSLCPDISPSSSHFFEVLYIGRIKVSHKKVPDTFIDDALDKFKIFEKQKKGKENPDDIKLSNGITTKGKGSSTYASTETLKSSDLQSDRSLIENGRRRSGSLGTVVPLIKKPENLTKENLTPELNRTMVFHVGRSDLRLISPDRKQVLLHKYLKDITFSAQGVKHCGHFAFVCKELTGDNGHSYVGYVFKCQSPSVAENLVTAINQASSSDKRTSVVSCEACPMVWYHRLCTDLEAANPAAAREALNRRLESLPNEEQAVVRTKLEAGGGGGDSMEVSMMLLRAHCEAKQARHAHDTPEARHEFLTHYLGGGAIFMKAKRSLTTSFDNLLKRKGSRDDIGPSLSLPHNATLCKDLIETPTKRISETDSIDGNEDPGTPGSMMNNIFMKLGKTPSRTPQDELKSRSWRHAIFNTVVTPSKAHPSENNKKPRDNNFYKDLWKKAINQQVLLIRMEKENAQLTARQEEATVKRIKVEYDEMGSSQTSCSEPWESLLKGDLCLSSDGIRQALKQGVAKMKRGEVWLYLSRLGCSDPPVDLSQFPNYHVPYGQLLKQLTSYQHAILIDLGRTFPNHPYFSSPLGPGQLSLFNLLKAYSLLDPGVGYCQGLSFTAGVLLLHMSEADAYELLKFLMFTRGLRERYLPEMTALQVCLYQLSRLLHDTHPDLYSHLDSLDIAPSLYAAPWILTFFSSQFSLGFVVRILDFVFGDSPDIVFKVALALLSLHKPQLLACDSFESVMDYLKVRLPQVSDAEFDIILNQVLSMDISRALTDYGVEYHVLEEMSSPRPEVKRIKELEEHVGGLNRQLQMAKSNTHRLEESRSKYMQQLNQLEAQVKGLEASVATLGEYMSELAYCRADITLPNDVVRILARHNVAQGRRLRDLKPQFSASDIRPSRISECSEYDEGKPKDTEADSLKKNEKNKTEEDSNISKPVGVGRLLTEEERKALVQARQTALERSKSSPSDSGNGSRMVRTASHPLDTGLVATSFEGTTRLKTIPSLRRADTAEVGCLRHADITEPASLRIIEKTLSDPVSLKIQSTKERVARLFGHRTSGPNQGSYDKLFGRETQLLIHSQQAVLGGDQRPNLI